MKVSMQETSPSIQSSPAIPQTLHPISSLSNSMYLHKQLIKSRNHVYSPHSTSESFFAYKTPLSNARQKFFKFLCNLSYLKQWQYLIRPCSTIVIPNICKLLVLNFKGTDNFHLRTTEILKRNFIQSKAMKKQKKVLTHFSNG